MPVLQIKLSHELPAGQQDVLVRELVHLSTQLLAKREAVTAAMVEVLGGSRWYVAGQALSVAEQRSAWLDITITQGTNTAEEKAAFVAQAHDSLRLHTADAAVPWTVASYVSVHELPADDWGYGGLTQAQRRVASMQDEYGAANDAGPHP